MIRIHNQLTIHNLQKQLQTQNSELKQVVKMLSQSQLAVVQRETIANLSRLAIGVVNGIEPPLWQISNHLVSIQQTLPVLSQYIQPLQSELLAEMLSHQSAIGILPSLAEAVDSIQAEAGQIRAILLALHQFADFNTAEVRSIDIHAAIDQMLLLLHPFFMRNQPRQIELVKDYGSLPPVTGYVNLFNQVMFNLLSRAIDALASNSSQAEDAAFQPTLRLKTEISDRATVLIYVQDNAIPANDIEIPANSPTWFPGSSLNGLTNLPIGVLVCQQIVAEIHRGHLTHQTLAQGSEFRIELPIHFSP